MAYVDWMIRGKKLAVCSCDYGCPCEFQAPPTRVPCEGLEAMEIDEGYFGEVRLDGLRFAGSYHWPGPVHEGNGHYQVVIDERASKPQVDALFKIMSGEEQEPTTVFNVYGSTITTEHEPIFGPIDFDWDYEAGTSRVTVPGVFSASTGPIRNPVTGEHHRAQIRLPTGFEFRHAEVVSGTFNSSVSLTFDYKDRYGCMTEVAYGPHGIVE